MKKELKVFVAGSLSLEATRDTVRSALLNVSYKYERYGYSIKSYSCENFDNSLCPEGRQNDYNYFIKNHADFVIFILDGKINVKTIEEFDHALDGLKQNNKPQIFVYNNIESITEDETVLHFKKKMNESNQYWTDYRNGGLKNIVMLNFDNAIFNLMKLEIPKYDASASPLSGNSTFSSEARKLDILFKEYTIKTVIELNDALQASIKSTLSMVQSIIDEGFEFQHQRICNENLRKALHKSQAVLPQNIYEIAYDMAVNYIQKGFNWVLAKIRQDQSSGKEVYDNAELLSMHETLIHDIVNIDEAQKRINQITNELMIYVNSL